MSAFTPSLRLHDRYVLRDRIGLGGMSEVWWADDEILGRPVAVKVLAGSFAVDPDLRAVLRREARAAARLAHPHVTQVYDYGEAALDGGTVVPFLVMELVDGQNLADRLADGPLPWPSALRTAAQVAAALAAAHRIGVVHRDIKPGNVMLTETGAKVLDFGIAAPTGPPHAGPGLTGEPMMGTPAYTAPERFGPGAPDPASDVYALGALLYRTVTGEPPLPVQSWEDALVVHANRHPVPPPRVPGLPADMADLMLACLDPDPGRRPTAGQLAARFVAGASGAASSATTVLPIVTTAVAHGAADPSTAARTATAAHPATLVDRTGTWSATARPPSAARSTPDGPTRSVAGRPRRPRRPVGALVATGLVLAAGIGTAVALGSGDEGVPAATPSSAPAAPPPTSSPPATSAAPRPSPTPSTARPEPVNLRQTAGELIALLTEGQFSGDIDRKVADRLRKDLAELATGKPKDREKRIEKLRDRLDDEVDRGRVPADFAERLERLLDQVEESLDDEDDD
ncbi:serine/threonine-protein kinase [Micromonospora sp. NPDC049900]|uniref:serine/threonine-protein kinase n=1 Tax=Micromonospora sp. NPDC049900 TaxID=3364275 RepID=UPI00378F732A